MQRETYTPDETRTLLLLRKRYYFKSAITIIEKYYHNALAKNIMILYSIIHIRRQILLNLNICCTIGYSTYMIVKVTSKKSIFICVGWQPQYSISYYLPSWSFIILNAPGFEDAWTFWPHTFLAQPFWPHFFQCQKGIPNWPYVPERLHFWPSAKWVNNIS